MNEEVKHELEGLRQRNGGKILAAQVVDFARNPETALHGYFEWDDSLAAEKYRLAQARALIRVAVVVEPTTSEAVRAYVSLSSDRQAGGGYRAIAEVLSDEILKETLLADALKDLTVFTRKYDALRSVTRLNRLFESIEDVVRSGIEESRPAA
jgi:hypothetical protein